MVGILWAVLLACSGGNGDDSDQNPSADDTATSVDDSGAPPVVDHATCDAYLECLQAVDAAAVGPALAAYGSGGTCWDSEKNAELCSEACATAMAELSKSFPEEAACMAAVTDTFGAGSWMLSLTWKHDGLDFDMAGWDGETYWVGLVRPGWSGEDCLDGDGDTYECAQLSPESSSLEKVEDGDDVHAGSTTLFDVSDRPVATIAVFNTMKKCWAVGANVDYYDEFDCQNLGILTPLDLEGWHSADVEWAPTRLRVTLDVEPTDHYEFGVVQTHRTDGEPCVGDGDCYTLEDCVYGMKGDTACHDVTSGGSANDFPQAESYFDVLYGYATGFDLEAMYENGWEQYITYILISDDFDPCWVWGDDPSYYDGLGCIEVP
jgi:hypothetical protein